MSPRNYTIALPSAHPTASITGITTPTHVPLLPPSPLRMDFSKYGVPSEQWRAFAEKNPAAAQDGHDGTDPSGAARLRETKNKARDATAEHLMAETGLRDQVTIETFQVPSRGRHTIPVRRYAPRDGHRDDAPVLVFFHGGGMLFGSETSDDFLCSNIAVENSITILSVIYRHTPEYKHPAQHNDAWDAFQFIRDTPTRLGVDLRSGVAMMGVSAGAGLAAGVIVRDLAHARNTPGYETIIKGLVLSIPWLIHIDNYPFHEFASREKASKIQCSEAPVVPAPRMKLFSDILDAQDPTDPLLNVGLTPVAELRGWPKTAFFIAGMDPLRDDGLLFAKRLEAAG